ncbi:FAD-binding protein [Novosphingobium sp. 9U]|uniref:FAD-binding protein n=1 Tax=Novosphingobium sp. 9U TaxID=2653158 RepID=UPI0012F3F198|nr:FAD-binding protein [Novosphingobium sp. 9U]VWX47271.1 FAD-binding protein [Novosphingobium sp. 9U]
MIRNLPEKWDLEVDLVAIGSGGGGLAAAITAQDHGLKAVVLERSDEVGGVTAYSMGEVWIPGNHHERELGIEDSPESGYRYVKSLSMGYGDERAMLNQSIHGPVALKYFEDAIGLKMDVTRNFPDYYYPHNNDSVAEGRYLEVEPFPAETLGEWQHKTRLTPHLPAGFTHHDIFRGGGLANMLGWDYELLADRISKDLRCLGPGLAAYFVKGALDRGIPLLTGTSAEELIGDGERIIGVRAVREGKDLFIKAERGVVIAVSGYERNPELAKTLSNVLEPVSMVMSTVDGAHFRLAGPVGARIARVPDPANLGIHMPGEEHDNGSALWRGSLPFLGLPHTIVVNRAGKRFANEAFYRSVYYAVDAVDGATQTHPNYPCWAVIDSQARTKYPFGSFMPGDELPEGLAVKGETLAELASKIGVDPQGLTETVERFNGFAAAGEDPDFKRGTYPWGAAMTGDLNHKPNPNLGTLEQGPYYAIELKRMGGGGITGTGLLADNHCRVIGWNDKPIEGLYVAGNSMARLDTGAVMQSGISNARGMTHGYLAGRHAAGKPSDLLDRKLASEPVPA